MFKFSQKDFDHCWLIFSLHKKSDQVGWANAFGCKWLISPSVLVFQAIKLTGQKLLNAPIIVQETQAEKNRLAAEAEKLKRPIGPTRIYVGSLHFNITEQMIKAIFEPFGIIDTVQMIHDSESGRSKGYCFIQFRDPDSAKRAMEQMNGFELAGRPIKVILQYQV